MRLSEHLRQRYRAILKYSGLVWSIIGLLVLSPLLGLPYYWDERSIAWTFLLPGIILVLVGLAFWRGFRPPEGLSLTVTEGTVIVVLSWLTATAVGAIPFMLASNLDLTQAYFESTSGWTTTGLSVVDVTTAPRMILLHRSIMQLAGGAGFAIIVRATLTGPTGIGYTSAEGREQQLAPHVRRSASIVLTIYLGYVLFGIMGLRLVGMGWFDAINHAFAALSTGGFSTRPESIGYWDSAVVEAFVIVLMILGTTNFLTSYSLLRGRVSMAFRSTQLRFFGFLLLLFIPIVLLGATIGLYPQLSKAVRVAVFEVVSAGSTTGFSTVSYGDWPALGWLVLLILMLIGGGAGSTAGGIKQLRVLILLRALLTEVRRWFLSPNVVTAPDIWQGGERRFLDDAQIRRDSTFMAFYLVTFLVGSGIIAAHGYSLAESLFEFASTVGTVGLSVGVVGATAPASLLWAQTVGMILGRLEFFALIVGVSKLISDLPALLRRTETEAEIIMKEGELQEDYFRVLVPVASLHDADELGRLGILLTRAEGGQLLVLKVITIPPLLNPLAGRFALREHRPLVERVVTRAKRNNVPVQGIVRSTRNVPTGIMNTVRESDIDLLLFSWPGVEANEEQAFGTIIDSIIANPPCDIGVFRSRPYDQLHLILVPVTGGANERLAMRTAVKLANSSDVDTVIQLAYVAVPRVSESEVEERASKVFDYVTLDVAEPYETEIVRASTAADGILQAAANCDMVIIGATREPLLRNLLLGNVAQIVAAQAPCPVIVVKRQSDPLRSVLRETVLRPVIRPGISVQD